LVERFVVWTGDEDEFPFDVAGKRGWTVESYAEEVAVCELGWVVEEFDVLLFWFVSFGFLVFGENGTGGLRRPWLTKDGTRKSRSRASPLVLKNIYARPICIVPCPSLAFYIAVGPVFILFQLLFGAGSNLKDGVPSLRTTCTQKYRNEIEAT